jgi:hypothetical protein
MAFLIKRKRSPFWAIRYRDPATGRWGQKSTKLRVGDREAKRAALMMAAELANREPQSKHFTDGERFSRLIPQFLEAKCGGRSQKKTRERYHLALRHWQEFCEQQKLQHPAQLNHEHILQYIAWRKRAD